MTAPCKTHHTNWKGGEIRLNDDGSIDEIVLPRCYVHLEQMCTGGWWLGLYVGDSFLNVVLTTRACKAAIKCTAESDDGKVSEGFTPSRTKPAAPRSERSARC